MADYPPTPSYGVNYGEQNNNYMPSYDQQQFAGANDRRVVSNPTYPLPPNPNAFAAAYSNMAASQYNSNMPAFASTSFQPLTQSHQSSTQPFQQSTQYGATMPPSNIPSYEMQQQQPTWKPPVGFPTATGWQQPPLDFTQNPPPPYSGFPRIDTNPHQQVVSPTVKPIEEGELSEGEFEDNHRGRPSSAVVNNGGYSAQARPDSLGYQYVPSRDSGFRDSPVGGVPPSGPRASHSFSHRKQVSPPRRQSDTYSPYGSPRQAYTNGRGKQRHRKGKHVPNTPSPRDSFQPPEPSHINMNFTLPKNSVSTETGGSNDLTKSRDADIHELRDVSEDDRYSPQLESPPAPDKKVPDKKSQAQHAILNLMAAKVRFQDYVDEGIDESVVHSLFDSLGMPQSRSKAVAKPPSQSKESSQPLSNGHTDQNAKSFATQTSQVEPRSSSENLPNSKNANGDSLQPGQQKFTGKEPVGSRSAASAIPSQDATARAVPNGEERKDRIARLLAEKQNKPSTSSQAAAMKAEKDRQLAIKLENLRKSRETRALKNEAPAVKVPIAPVSSEAKSSPAASLSPKQPTSQIPKQLAQPQPLPQQSFQLPSGSASRVSSSTFLHVEDQAKSDGLKSIKDNSVSLSMPLPPKPLPPKPSVVIPQSVPAPVIPGLFLSATGATTPATSTGFPSVSSGQQQRKRPVAADFDEPVPAYKRPFGQSRIDKPLVIEVSDDEESDEDEGSAMDLDQPDHGSNGQTIFPNVGSKLDKDNRPSSAQSNLLAQSNSKLPTPGFLQTKEKEIADLHRRIAEAEAKKKAKLTLNRSGSQTPSTAEVAKAQYNLVNEAIAEKNKASAELERLLDGGDGSIAPKEPQKTEKIDVEQQEKSSEKVIAIERKRKRRSEIQLGLPVVDAEVERNQQRVEELRMEMEKAQAAMRKSLEDKQKMEEEMAKLGDEAEEQLQTEQTQQLKLTMRGTPSARATPEKVSEPTLEKHSPEAISATTPITPQLVQNGVLPEQQNSRVELINQTPVSQYLGILEDAPSHEERVSTPDANTASPVCGEQEPRAGTSDSMNSAVSKEEDNHEVIQGRDSPPIVNEVPHTHSPTSVSADQVLEAALQQASAQAEAESGVTDDVPIKMADTYASDPSELEPTIPHVPIEIDNSYAPDPSELEPATPPSIDVAEDEGHVSSEAAVNQLPDEGEVMDEDSDPYEPPEATPPFQGGELMTSNSPLFSPAPPNVVSEPSPKGAETLSTTNPEPFSIEPLNSQTNGDDIKIEAEARDRKNSKAPTYFTPYESPLKQLSSYRFNKNFVEEVAGGFRSATYSHGIDPMKEFCPFELQGGICNDTNCEFQHFKDVHLAENLILLQLGDSETFESNPGLKDSFVTGLRAVLQDLKARKVRDFSSIAFEIAAFRTKFNEEHMDF